MFSLFSFTTSSVPHSANAIDHSDIWPPSAAVDDGSKE
jgi:hypothetical protein